MSRQMGFNLESGKYKQEAQAWGFALTSVVLALLWAGVSAWGCPLGETEDTKTKSWNMFLAAP